MNAMTAAAIAELTSQVGIPTVCSAAGATQAGTLDAEGCKQTQRAVNASCQACVYVDVDVLREGTYSVLLLLRSVTA